MHEFPFKKLVPTNYQNSISRSFSSDACQGNRQNKECRAETAYKSAKREKRSSF